MENSLHGTYPIIIDGNQLGDLQVTQEGLMTVFEGKCEEIGVLLRISVYGEKEGYLGVMAPERGYLRIRKRFSRAGLADFPKKIKYAGPAGEKVKGDALAQEMTDGFADQSGPAIQAMAGIKPGPGGSEEIIAKVPKGETSKGETSKGEAPKEEAPKGEVLKGDKGTPLKSPRPVPPPVAKRPVPKEEEPSKAREAPKETQEEGAGQKAPKMAKDPAEDQLEKGSDQPENQPCEMDQVTYWIPEPNPWSLFFDSAIKNACRGITGALTTVQEDVILLAIPLREDGSFPRLPAYSVASAREIEGEKYAVFKVKNGKLV